MNAFLLPCVCGSEIPVTAAQAGGSAPCPTCGRQAAVPKYRDLARLRRGDERTAPASPRRRAPWTVFHTMLLLGSMLAVGCGLGSLSFVPPEVEMFDGATIRDSVLRAPTDEVLSVLRTRLQSSGVDRPPTEMEAKTRARSDYYYRLRDGLRLAAGAGLASALIGALGLLLARNRGAGGGESR